MTAFLKCTGASAIDNREEIASSSRDVFAAGRYLGRCGFRKGRTWMHHRTLCTSSEWCAGLQAVCTRRMPNLLTEYAVHAGRRTVTVLFAAHGENSHNRATRHSRQNSRCADPLGIRGWRAAARPQGLSLCASGAMDVAGARPGSRAVYGADLRANRAACFAHVSAACGATSRLQNMIRRAPRSTAEFADRTSSLAGSSSHKFNSSSASSPRRRADSTSSTIPRPPRCKPALQRSRSATRLRCHRSSGELGSRGFTASTAAA